MVQYPVFHVFSLRSERRRQNLPLADTIIADASLIPSSDRRVFRASWLLAGLVAMGNWCIQTDYFPIPQGVRPSWYVYGWPICFGTSGRGRFNFSSFDWAALTIDVVVFVLMVGCTMIASNYILRRFPRYSLLDALAAICGFSILFAVIFGGTASLLSDCGFDLPSPDYSEMAGNTRVWSRLSPLVMLSLWLGTFSCGFAAVPAVSRLSRVASNEQSNG